MTANVFVQARDVVDVGVRLLQKDLTIANLFFKNPQIDWSGRQGDSVTVRVPQRLSAARKFGAGWRPNADIGPTDGTTPGGNESPYDSYASGSYGSRPSIRLDTVGETTTTLAIDEFIYKALGVTLEDLTLSTPDFVSRYMPQMVRVVAERIEDKCIAQLAATNWYNSHSASTDPQNVLFSNVAYKSTASVVDYDGDAGVIVNTINKMRRALNGNFVPLAGRTLVVGVDVEDRLLLSNKFQRNDSVGNSDALREATVGRIMGMDVVVNPTIDPDTMYLFSDGSFLLSTVTPRTPEGAVQAANTTGEGLSLMYVQDYDTQHAIDRVMVSLLAGTGAVQDGPLVSSARTMVRAAKANFVLGT